VEFRSPPNLLIFNLIYRALPRIFSPGAVLELDNPGLYSNLLKGELANTWCKRRIRSGRMHEEKLGGVMSQYETA